MLEQITMLSYKDCEELKAKGFPQEPSWVGDDVECYGGSWYFLVKEDACSIHVFADPDQYKKGIERGDVLLKIPSPSELIEACGDNLKCLNNLSDQNCWHAISLDSLGALGIGITPEEAVKNLWLALHPLTSPSK